MANKPAALYESVGKGLKMILKLMKWWLNKHGYHVIPFNFVGVIMGGNCVATGTPEQLNVYNPSKRYVALTGTIVMFDQTKVEHANE